MVSTVSFHRPWLMMNKRPAATPADSTRERLTRYASPAAIATTTTGGGASMTAMTKSRVAVTPLAMESKNQAK
jgi:hypothetical protein